MEHIEVTLSRYRELYNDEDYEIIKRIILSHKWRKITEEERKNLRWGKGIDFKDATIVKCENCEIETYFGKDYSTIELNKAELLKGFKEDLMCTEIIIESIIK